MKLALCQFSGFVFFLLTAFGVSFAAAPDLIITDVWSEGTTIRYQIQNVGDADCTSSHTTQLIINGQSCIQDVVTQSLAAGQRLNRIFYQWSWTCTGTSQAICVIADIAQDITESDEGNNERLETWTCDQQAPLITEEPTVTKTTTGSYKVTWKTDELSDSLVYYGRVGLFSGAGNLTLTQDHVIYISQSALDKGVPYRYKVCSTDASGNTVESKVYYFITAPVSETTAPQVEAPVAMRREQPIFPIRFDVSAFDNTEVDRVVFSLDGQLLMTDYDPPFCCYFDPGSAGLTRQTYFDMDHTLVAEAFDLCDNSALSQQAWYERPACPEMELEIELGQCSTVYTPNVGISFFIGEFQIMARQNAGFTCVGIGEGSTPDAFTTNWDQVDEIEVFYDDSSIGTIIPDDEETDFTYPLLIGYLDAPSTHEIKVKIHAGVCTKTSRATMRVIRQLTEVSVERTVDRVGSAFNVAVTLTNNGTTNAILDTLVEEAEGFQITVPPRSLYEAAVTYDPQTRRCRVEYDFSDTLSADGGSRTYYYTAIPFLSEGVDEYRLGEENRLSYHDVFDRDYSISVSRVSRVEGHLVEDAVEDACDDSDYLIVTNPVALLGLHNDDSVNELLSKTAELAALRNGIMAYYVGAGSVLTAFSGSDKVACGNIKNDWKDEIVVMDESDDKIRIYNTSKQLTINRDDEELLPIYHEGLHSDDVLLVGNFLEEDDPANPNDEIIIFDGHSSLSFLGEFIEYDYNAGSDEFDKYESEIVYRPSRGDQILAGDILYDYSSPLLDEILLFDGASGEVWCYDGTGFSHGWWASVYSAGDLVAAGNLIAGSDMDEIVIGDISEQEIVVYSYDGVILHQYSCTLESGDTLHVCADGLALADVSEGRISIRGIDEGDDWSMGGFDLEIPADDAFLCGQILDTGIQQYLLAHAERRDHYANGAIDIFTYSDEGYSEPPGDRERLEELLNPGGEWADKMGTDFTDGGYLLIIGETEVIPAFACSYEVSNEVRYVEFTDNYYGNTSGDMKFPEISVGRIIGTSIDVMKAPLQTSLDIAAGDKELNFDRACCISGGEEERFETSRSAIVDVLEDDGWDVARYDEPSEDTFFANCSDRDAIYMAAHGNWSNCWNITSSEVTSRFNPGDAAPIVYAASCLTGRYPEGVNSFGESFLSKGASAFIGASENSISPWSKYLAEGFFERLDWGSAIGSALKGAKRNRMGDRGHGKYMSAIYHYFGDPKLEAVSTVAAASGSKAAAQQSDIVILESPPTTLQVTIPDFTVRTTGDGDIASIPGGISLAEIGHPEVPAWPVQIQLPAGTFVQDVELTGATEIVSGTGLGLIVVQPEIDGEIHTGPELGDPNAWPNRQYDWTVEPNPDGSSQLTISIYPLRSWPETTNYTFFTQCTFNITYNTSTISINRLWTNHKVYNLYDPCDSVDIELFLKNSGEPVDVIAEGELIRNDGDSVSGLQVKFLSDVQGLVSCNWTWDSSMAPAGTYDLKVRIKSLDGLLLAEQSTMLQMGKSDGTMQPVTTNPVCFSVGNDIKIHTGFTNTGQVALNPRLIVEIYDVDDGTLLKRFESTTTNLAAGAEYLTHWEWTPTRARGDCRFKAYTLYDGKSTPVKFYPELSAFVDGDFNSDDIVNLADFALLAGVWLSDDTICDIAPDGGDCIVDLKDLDIIIDTWLNGIGNSVPACNTAADLNCDGDVDTDDLLYMTDVWLTNDTTADIAEPADGIVDLKDFSILSRYWLN